MTGESAQGKLGGIFKYYTCVKRKKHECEKTRIRKEWLEEHIIKIVNQQILTDETIDRFVEAYRKNMNKISDQDKVVNLYRSELAEVERKISNITKAIADGAWSKNLAEMLDGLEERQDELLLLIRKEEAKEPQITPEMVREYFTELKERAKIEDECQQTLVDVFVRRIYVWNAKKDDSVRAVIELSLTGSDGDPETYEAMLEECSSEIHKVNLIVKVSNTSLCVIATI
jgi:hypothetical protein